MIYKRLVKEDMMDVIAPAIVATTLGVGAGILIAKAVRLRRHGKEIKKRITAYLNSKHKVIASNNIEDSHVYFEKGLMHCNILNWKDMEEYIKANKSYYTDNKIGVIFYLERQYKNSTMIYSGSSYSKSIQNIISIINKGNIVHNNLYKYLIYDKGTFTEVNISTKLMSVGKAIPFNDYILDNSRILDVYDKLVEMGKVEGGL